MSKSSDDNATKTRTTKNITKRRSKTVSKAFTRPEGRSVEQSEITWVQGHISDDQGISIRRSGCNCHDSRSPHTGKILEALKLIEEKHLSYVKEDQQHLATRLDESKKNESDFKKAIQELEAQIHQLISDKPIEENP